MVLPLIKPAESLDTLSVPSVEKGFMSQFRPGLSLLYNPSRNSENISATGIPPPEVRSRGETLIFQGVQSLGSLIRIRHPIIGFLEELTDSIRQVSDQSLKTQPEQRTTHTEKSFKDNLAMLLGKLEHGEKVFELISHSLPSLDEIQILAIESSHKCASLVRDLRKDLISLSYNSDITDRRRTSSLVTLLDNTNHQLFAEKLAFQRAVVEFIKSESRDSASQNPQQSAAKRR